MSNPLNFHYSMNEHYFLQSFHHKTMLLRRVLSFIKQWKNKRTTSANLEIIDDQIWNCCGKDKMRLKPKSRQKFASFHKSMRWFLLVLCIFSIYPVSGIMSRDSGRLSYKKRTVRFALASVLLAFATFETCCGLRWFFVNQMFALRATGVVFYICTMTSLYFFHFVARRWHEYVLYWKTHERVFLSEPYPAPTIDLERLLTGIAFLTLMIAFVEHSCFIASELFDGYQTTVRCNATTTNYIALAYYQQKIHIIMVTGFSNWMVPLLEWTNICMNIAWNSGDIFIVVISIALVTRFQQFNNRVWSSVGKGLSEDEWRELRTHYGLLVDLTRKTDKLLSNLIFLSCSNNLYFICTFLFHIGDERSHVIFHLRHWITTIYLIFRTIMVLYMGASVYESSRQILPTLKSVSAKGYNIEIKRFTDQIIAEPALLSGNGFFYLTKPLILAMAGVIATYEIVLMNQLKSGPRVEPSCVFEYL